MSSQSNKCNKWVAGTLVAATICIVSGIAASAGFAAEPSEHVFNPLLSLTGGCKSSPIDPVPDPGCPEGQHPPLGSFETPQAVAIDNYGEIYVANYGSSAAQGKNGRIDIFDPQGTFIAEIPDPSGPKSLAVDSKGNIYVFHVRPGMPATIDRFSPSLYNPEAGQLTYDKPAVTVLAPPSNIQVAMDINRSNDHLYLHLGPEVREFGAAEEGNPQLDTIGKGTLSSFQSPLGFGLAVDSSRGRIYVSDLHYDSTTSSITEFFIDVFALKAPHALLQQIKGATTPQGKFASELALAVDEGTGHIFALMQPGAGDAVYELTEEGTYLSAIQHSFQYVYAAQIGVDNGAHSPNGVENQRGRYLFVPSHPTNVGHSFAFGPAPACPPTVDSTSFSEVTDREARLEATIAPCYLETSYIIEYTTRERFEEEGFASAKVAESGVIPAGGAGVEVSASLEGLAPETEYVFLDSSQNDLGSDQGENEFATYPPAESIPPCPNAAVRTGFSALLPDCRAYELVTPANSNARAPRGVGHLGIYFATREASPLGDRVSFIVEGGVLPGEGGTGSLGGDPYLSTRGGGGWNTSSAGPAGGESVALLPGSTSPDQGYSFWSTGGPEGSAAIEDEETKYVRYPDGHSELIGRGSLAEDPLADGKLISEGGAHIVFASRTFGSHPAVQLEENGPPAGTSAVYDRTSDEVTHVISLLPGNETPAEGEDALYQGASLDGKGVAFTIGKTLYLRYDNQETFEIGENLIFAGIAEGGKRIFYLEGENLYAFDVDAGEANPIAFSTSGDVTPVNVAADGGVAYFVSPSALAVEPNPNGELPVNGQQNLYRSEEGLLSFVGTVTKRDVEGEWGGIEQIDGLGLWTAAAGPGQFGKDPSRTTPDGSVLLFESRAALAGYDPLGYAEIYRYDAVSNQLECLSCNPTLAPARGDASLQSVSQEIGGVEPFSSYARVVNLRPDGRRAFFQSPEPLALSDTDGLQDVYEWEEQGVGTCQREGGCVSLISSGQSTRADYLYAVSDSGDDVFFRTWDLLLSSDREETASIYDARVGGGFPGEEVSPTCEGEGCRPALPPPPPMIGPESGTHGYRPPAKTCPAGKRKVKRHGKVVCLKKRKHRHRKSQSKGMGK